MDKADLVNRIIAKLGGNRVEFLAIESDFDDSGRQCEIVEFLHSSNHYTAKTYDGMDTIEVRQYFRDQGRSKITAYTTWIEGVLNGKVRTESGELV